MNRIGAYNFQTVAMRANEYDNNVAYNNATYPQAYDNYNAYDTYESMQEPVVEKKKSNLGTLLLGALAVGATVFAVLKHRAAKNAIENATKDVAEQVKKLQDDLAAKDELIDKFTNETRKEARQRIKARNKARRAEEGGFFKRMWNKITKKNKPEEPKETIEKVAEEAAEAAKKD